LTTESGVATGDAIVTFAFTTCPGVCAQAIGAARQTKIQIKKNAFTFSFGIFIIVPWNGLIWRWALSFWSRLAGEE
jgi:hypothetical protein